MNKTSKFLFSTLVAAAAMTSTAWAWNPDNGDYTIDNLEEFKAFRDYVNEGNNCAGKTVTLTANIDLASEEWTPIGNSTNSFNGTFDGGNYTISNLVVNGGSESDKGLFGFTQNGAVKNFTLENAQVSGRLNVGAVAGTPYTSEYSNITLTGHVEIQGMAYVGGVGGKNAYANWTNVTVDADATSFVKANSVENGTAYRTYVGGVIGFMGEGGHTLSNISSNINVEGSTIDVGGIVGIAHYGNKFVNVTCTAGSITLTNGTEASDATEVGAIAGVWHNENGTTVTFENCTVGEGTTVSKTYDVGGEKVTESLVGAGALYGSAYSANGTGVLNLSASGKQYAYDATIGRGVKEVYGQVTLGWNSANAEVPYVDATLNVAGTLDAENLYVYVNSELAVQEGGSLNSNYLINWGEISATNAESFNVNSLYLYGRETLEGTNYPTGDQLGKLTLVGTDATIGRLQLGRVDSTSNTVMGNASVTLTNSSLTVGMLAHGTVSGNEVQSIVADKDSSLALVKGGSLAGTLKSDGEVTLGWNPSNAEVPYVDASLKVSGTLDAKELYVYVNSELAVQEGGSLKSNYLINWGEISANNAESFNVNSLYLYGRETLEGTNYPTGDQLGKLTLVGTDATIGNLQLGRVDSASNTVMGNASVTLTDSSLTVGTLAHGTVSGNEVQTITLDNSTLKITGDAQLVGSLSLNNSTLTAKVISGNGLILGSGIVNLNVDTNSTQVFVGGYYDAEGNRQYNDGDALRSKLVLNDVSGNGVMIKDKEFRVNNADITLNANVMADLGNGVFFYLRESTLDLNGHDLVLNSGKFLSTGLDIIGEGTVVINSPSDQACWQSYASSIGSQATVKGTKQFTIYEDLTVYGKLINEGKAGNGPTHIGFNDDFWTDGAVLTVSGENALVSQTGGAGVQIHGADAKQGIAASKVVVENGATVDWTQAGTVTNNGTIEVRDATFKAASVVGNGLILGNGAVNLSVDSSSAQVLVGGYYDAEGNRQYNDGEALRSTLVLDDVSGNGVMIKDKEFRVNNADITLNADVTADLGNGVYFYLRESNLNLNGKNLTVDGGKLVTSNLELSGTGTVTITGKTEMPCWQGNNNVVGEDVTVNSGIQITVYGALTVYGTLNTAETGHGNGADRIGYTPWSSTHNAVLVLSGEKASYTQSGNYGLVIDGENNGLFVEKGASVSLGGGTATNNGVISVSGSSFSATGTLVNNGTFEVYGESTLNIGTLNGSSIDLMDGAIIKNSTVGGAAYVAGNVVFRGDNTFTMITDYGDYYSKETPSMWTVEKGASLTLTKNDRYGLGYGDKVAVYGELENARKEGLRDMLTDADASLNLYGGLVGMTNSASKDAENTFTVEDAYVIFGVEGDKSFGNKPGNYYGKYTFTFDNSVVTANGFKFYEDEGQSTVYFKDSDLLVNGVFMTNDSNSTFTFENSVIYSKATSNGSDDKNQNAGTLNLINSSLTYNAKFTNVGSVVLSNGSTLVAPEIVNNGYLQVDGGSTLENQTISGSGWIYAENAQFNNVSVSGNDVYMMGTNVNGGTFGTVYSGYGVVNGEWQTAGDTESVISGNVVAGSWYDYGKTTVASGATIKATNFYAQGTNGATIDGTVEVSGIFRGYNGTISESGKVVAGTAVHLYGNTVNQREYNIKGELIASNDGNHGSVFEVGSAYVKQYYGDNGEYWSIGGANTVVNVSGSVTLKAGKDGAANARVNVDEEGYKATLNITDGGSVVVEGTLTNNGFINVDRGTLTAVTIVNNGSITLNNATFNVTNLTGTGTLTMLGDSHVTDGSEESSGVEIDSIVVKTESNSVALSASAGTIVFGGVQEVTESANTEITTLAANESVAIAWHFDVSGIESGESVTIETTIKTGLNDSEINIFHKGDEDGAEWTEADVSDVNYDATTGKLSFKANSFSSYAVVVPEPSMFGLFAGLGALLLVGTRRRRR